MNFPNQIKNKSECNIKINSTKGAAVAATTTKSCSIRCGQLYGSHYTQLKIKASGVLFSQRTLPVFFIANPMTVLRRVVLGR